MVTIPAAFVRSARRTELRFLSRGARHVVFAEKQAFFDAAEVTLLQARVRVFRILADETRVLRQLPAHLILGAADEFLCSRGAFKVGALERRMTLVGAGIVIHGVAVVAPFISGCLDKAVSAAGRLAQDRAGVSIILVAVIALLGTFLHAVAAFCRSASADIGLAGEPVAATQARLPAFFPGLRDTVPALRQLARVAAAVRVHAVAVVTFFSARGLVEAIAAARRFAQDRAGVSIILVPVVALFGCFTNTIAALVGSALADCRLALEIGTAAQTRFAALFACLSYVVAAPGQQAAVGASIGIHAVAVIALLAPGALGKAVSATGQLAQDRASVVIVRVAVVTLFTALADTVAAIAGFALAQARFTA